MNFFRIISISAFFILILNTISYAFFFEDSNIQKVKNMHIQGKTIDEYFSNYKYFTDKKWSIENIEQNRIKVIFTARLLVNDIIHDYKQDIIKDTSFNELLKDTDYTDFEEVKQFTREKHEIMISFVSDSARNNFDIKEAFYISKNKEYIKNIIPVFMNMPINNFVLNLQSVLSKAVVENQFKKLSGSFIGKEYFAPHDPFYSSSSPDLSINFNRQFKQSPISTIRIVELNRKFVKIYFISYEKILDKDGTIIDFIQHKENIELPVEEIELRLRQISIRCGKFPSNLVIDSEMIASTLPQANTLFRSSVEVDDINKKWNYALEIIDKKLLAKEKENAENVRRNIEEKNRRLMLEKEKQDQQAQANKIEASIAEYNNKLPLTYYGYEESTNRPSHFYIYEIKKVSKTAIEVVFHSYIHEYIHDNTDADNPRMKVPNIGNLGESQLFYVSNVCYYKGDKNILDFKTNDGRFFIEIDGSKMVHNVYPFYLYSADSINESSDVLQKLFKYNFPNK